MASQTPKLVNRYQCLLELLKSECGVLMHWFLHCVKSTLLFIQWLLHLSRLLKLYPEDVYFSPSFLRQIFFLLQGLHYQNIFLLLQCQLFRHRKYKQAVPITICTALAIVNIANNLHWKLLITSSILSWNLYARCLLQAENHSYHLDDLQIYKYSVWKQEIVHFICPY